LENYSKLSIKQVQGDSLESPFAGKDVCTSGVVTGVLKRGFFLQTPDVEWDGVSSDAIFVYCPDWEPDLGAVIQVEGEVINYLKHDTAKPVTQIHMQAARPLKSRDSAGKPLSVTPIEFSQQLLARDNPALVKMLNALEGMLVKIHSGQTFIAPSNPFGDYVLALDSPTADTSAIRSANNGALVDKDNHLRWFPGFRITNYNHAPRVNVGAVLLDDVLGPLNYRADAYQISQSVPVKVEPAFIGLSKSRFKPSKGALTVLTLNCFNLDPHIESAEKVKNPRQDVDDDWGEGRFHTLAQAIVLQANAPDIVALQEIQDSDGAELTEVVDASRTYALLIDAIEELSQFRYEWVDVNPVLGADGGQPGGNIRNGYLYNPNRVNLIEKSVTTFGVDDPAFEDSRKPLLAVFEEQASRQKLACINLHLASKRHQNSLFAPLDPGVDGKLEVRVAQAACVSNMMRDLHQQGLAYYVTGDFNDTEHSATLATMVADHSVNLVESLPKDERYDYNHRGKLQVLMHGLVHKSMESAAQYEIIHGNELLGVTPGEESNKPSDHAYVIAKLSLAQ